MIELDPAVSDARPAELRFLKPLGVKTNTGAIPLYDLDPVCSFRPEDIESSVERITVSIAHQRQQAVWPLTEVDRMARKKDFYVRRDHADRTALITRRRCASSASTPARTTTSPIMISMAELAAITDPIWLSANSDGSGALSVTSSRRHL
nr:hypothetical protein [Agrobacterium sp. FDAARGOS_525]